MTLPMGTFDCVRVRQEMTTNTQVVFILLIPYQELILVGIQFQDLVQKQI